MYQEVRTYIQKHRMLKRKDKVVAGVSGGPDSICLLFMLLKLRQELELSLAAVHIHHGLRQAADADEAYVRRLCSEWGVKLFVFHENVAEYARIHKLTMEEAGRNVRRMRFEEVSASLGGAKIALAHHQDDNAETLLLNLCRGSRLRGLGGIAPVEGAYIRPLLGIRKREIESYLEKRGISYCTDETNQEMCYTRNRIRGRVLPCLEENVNPRAMEHIADTAQRLRLAAEFVREEAEKCRQACVRQEENGEALLEESFREISPFLRREVLYETICRAAGTRKDIGAVHVRLTEELLEKQVGRRIDLPGDAWAERCYEGLRFFRKSLGEPPEIPGEFKMRVFDRPEGVEAIPQKTYTKWFDYDIIKNTVKIRHRQAGDYLTINSQGGRQKLKQYFINEKIPREARDRIWLAADADHVMWVVGYRQNQAYQITDKTRRILEIEFCGGKSNGRDSESND